jgi:hypothetical protein
MTMLLAPPPRAPSGAGDAYVAAADGGFFELFACWRLCCTNSNARGNQHSTHENAHDTTKH